MRLGIVVIGVLIATLFLQATTAPTFDFDEALYRRVAEEMKSSHEYFVATWDGRPFYEKPPTYIWSIVLASMIFDGRDPHVSVFASRFPSLFCSILTMILLAWFWRRMAPAYARAFNVAIDGGRAWLLSPFLPVLAYGAGLFAMGGASSVVLDPMLTLCLLGPLLVFSGAFLRSDSKPFDLTLAEIAIAGAGMAGATAVKGLIGIVLPAFAIAIHVVITRKQLRWSRRSIGRVAAAFAIGCGSAAAFYAVIYQFTGSRFLYEFFVRQHFVRAIKPLQGHGGSLFFHVAVVMLLGGPLVAFLFRAMTRHTSLVFTRWGFPLTWTASVILFYTAVATKLPNYTWPVWPALVIALCILLVRSYAAAEAVGKRLRRTLTSAAFIGLLPLPIVLIALGSGVEHLWRPAPSTRPAMMLSAIEPLPVSIRIGLIVAGLVLALQIVDVAKFGRQLERRSQALWQPLASAAVLNCLALTVLSLIVLPGVDRLLRGPLVRLARDASAEHVAGGDLITVGLFSPTVSSSYDGGPVRQIGHFARSFSSAPGQHLLLVPAWRLSACRQPEFTVIRNDSFLTLCEKRGRAQERFP